jgi:hypothetical protein
VNGNLGFKPVGHTLLIAAVDGKSSGLDVDNIIAYRGLVELGASLIPFCSINSPTHRSSGSLWLHAGDQEAWKIRIKATGGLLMNGTALAIALAMIKLAILNIANMIIFNTFGSYVFTC